MSYLEDQIKSKLFWAWSDFGVSIAGIVVAVYVGLSVSPKAFFSGTIPPAVFLVYVCFSFYRVIRLCKKYRAMEDR